MDPSYVPIDVVTNAMLGFFTAAGGWWGLYGFTIAIRAFRAGAD